MRLSISDVALHGPVLRGVRRCPVTTGAKGRGRWRFSGLRDELLSGRPAELEFNGDMREWLTMTEIDRWSELFRLAHDKLDSVARDGLEPPRQARTSLGFGLLGSWAPRPVRTGEFRLALPDGSELDVHGEALPDGEWILYVPRSAGEKGKEDG
jgi:hypothetical protein